MLLAQGFGIPFWFVILFVLLLIGTPLGLFAILMAVFRNQRAARLAAWPSIGIGTCAVITMLFPNVGAPRVFFILILAIPSFLGAVALALSRYCQGLEKSGFEPPYEPETRKSFRFSLRTLLGSVWVIAAMTAQRDLITMIFVGVPVAIIGFVFIALDVSVRRRFSSLLASLACISLCCLFIFYAWPRIICPIELPRTARNVYVSKELALGWQSNPYTYVRFQAPVEDCIATAEAVLSTAHDQFRSQQSPPEVINRSKGKVPTNPRFRGNKWWFNTDYIDNGSYYNGLYYSGQSYGWIWIDTDRGIFYLYDSGF
jgi:hypothetical protein